jgi:excisionase family DNA binding protein
MFEQQFIDALADAVAAKVIAQIANSHPSQGRLMTVADAASYLGRSKQAIYHLIHSGAIPIKRQGTRVFIDRVELNKWIDALVN